MKVSKAITVAVAALILFSPYITVSGAQAQAASPSAYENGVVVDPGAKTLCLAMAHSFTSRAAEISDKLKTFDQTFTTPDADEQKIRDDLVTLQSQFSQLGSALEDLFSDADAPDQAQQTYMDALSASDLLSASQKCTG